MQKKFVYRQLSSYIIIMYSYNSIPPSKHPRRILFIEIPDKPMGDLKTETEWSLQLVFWLERLW